MTAGHLVHCSNSLGQQKKDKGRKVIPVRNSDP